MKKSMFSLLLFLVPLALFSQKDTPPIISVLNFQASGISKAELDVFVDYLTSAIVRTGKYRVIDRTQREVILKEIEFSMSDCTDENCQLEIGKLLSAHQIVVGSLGKVADRFLMSIKLIEVETGETLQSASDKYSSMNDLIDHSQELVSRLIGVEVAVSRSESEGHSVEKPAQKETISKSTINSLGMIFVLMEGGTFQMGDTAGVGGSDEKPVHSVTVSSFYLGKYEVTQKEWVAVMGSNPSNFKGDNLPVECVSWFDTVDFCNRLSVKEGLQPCYTISGTSVSCDFSKNGYRLPTEAEWEYAAKGGRSSRDYMYAGGNDVGTVGWYGGNSGSTTHPVGGKQANELGLYDMSGNVWEWCWDWYGDYSAGSQTDPRGPSSGQYRLLRGGSWDSNVMMLPASNRSGYGPGYPNNCVGFRLARLRP